MRILQITNTASNSGFFYKRIASFYTRIYSTMPAWYSVFQGSWTIYKKCIWSDLLKHDLIALLDVVLPDGVGQLRAVVYEVVGPQHVHRGHVASLSELGRQERELIHNNVNTLQLSFRKKATIPGSDFFPSRIPDPNFFIPDPGSASKNLSILTPKNSVQSSRKYEPGCSSRNRILTFYPSRIQGSKRHRIPDPEYWRVTWVTNLLHQYWMCQKERSIFTVPNI